MDLFVQEWASSARGSRCLVSSLYSRTRALGIGDGTRICGFSRFAIANSPRPAARRGAPPLEPYVYRVFAPFQHGLTVCRPLRRPHSYGVTPGLESASHTLGFGECRSTTCRRYASCSFRWLPKLRQRHFFRIESTYLC